MAIIKSSQWKRCLFALVIVAVAVIVARGPLVDSKSELARVPFELTTIENDYELWQSRKILETIIIPCFGEQLQLDIVYNDRTCVEGFIRLAEFPTKIDMLEARMSDHQITAVTYRDCIWIKLSKREYMRIHGPF